MRKVTQPKTEKIPDTIGKRIEFLRKKAGESQEQLATILTVTRNFLNMIEANTRIPNIDMVMAIAKRYSVTSDFLLCLSDIPNGTANEMAIEKELGLSGKAQEVLCEFNKMQVGSWHKDDRVMAKIDTVEELPMTLISKVLENKSLLELICYYFAWEPRIKKENSIFKNQEINAILLEIQIYLMSIRNSIYPAI